jgi:hypothetical protein
MRFRQSAFFQNGVDFSAGKGAAQAAFAHSILSRAGNQAVRAAFMAVASLAGNFFRGHNFVPPSHFVPKLSNFLLLIFTFCHESGTKVAKISTKADMFLHQMILLNHKRKTESHFPSVSNQFSG